MAEVVNAGLGDRGILGLLYVKTPKANPQAWSLLTIPEPSIRTVLSMSSGPVGSPVLSGRVVGVVGEGFGL